MDKNVIEIKDVSFRYQESADFSLEHVNLNVKEGEIVVLCGMSGCGKSTVIRLINGLIPFYHKGQIEGEVRVLGHSTKDCNIYDLGTMVSTVFQNPKSQFFCVDVISEMAFGAENLKFEKQVSAGSWHANSFWTARCFSFPVGRSRKLPVRVYR